MKYDRITFDDTRKIISGIIGYEPKDSYELTPNEIFCVIKEVGVTLEGKKIPNWTDFEYGKREMSTNEFLAQTKISLNTEKKNNYCY